jgi:hypothetical protein
VNNHPLPDLPDGEKVIHLIERVKNPRSTYQRLAEFASDHYVLIDLSAGSVSAVSPLDEIRDADGCQRWVRASDYASTLAAETRDRYVKWLADIADREILDGKSIKEWFTYDDEISLWWFSNMANKHWLGHPYRWLFYGFGLIDTVFETGTVEVGAEWHLWVPDLATGEALKAAIGGRGRVFIHAEDEKTREAEASTFAALRNSFSRILRASLIGPGRRFRRRPHPPFSSTSGSRPRVLINTLYPKSWRTITPRERFDPDVTKVDFYLGSLPWKLKAQGMDVAWLCENTVVNSHRTWNLASRETGLEDASPWADVGADRLFLLLRHQVSWLRTFEKLFVQHAVQEKWCYGNIPLGFWLVEDYRKLCEHGAVAMMLRVEQFRAVAERLKPDVVIYRDEMYTSGRAVSAAFAGKAFRLGVQHGIIHSEYTVYMFDKSELPTGSNDTDYISKCPTPDAFAVFGAHTRELFKEWNGFDVNRVFAVGGARHDALVETLVPEATDISFTRDLRSSFDLPADDYTVLLCTNEAHTAGEWFDLVVDGIQRAGIKAHVVVKTHPSRGGEENVHQVAQRRGFNDYELRKDATYPLIAAADVVVAGTSTIILESYLLGSPAITLSGSSNYEVYPFVAESLGESVADASEMAQALKKLFEDSVAGGECFRERRQSILLRHLWNDDARAGERISDLITSAMADRRADPGFPPPPEEKAPSRRRHRSAVAP